MIQGLTLATSELWCIAPGHAAGVRQLGELPPPRRAPVYPYALVEIVGTLTKPRMVAMREKIAAAAANPAVGEIVLLVDSPGGTVAGTHDLYLTIAAAAQRKRVVAVVEDQATSGALYAIAGATEILIGETAMTGSIGVYTVAVDESKLLERIGVEVVIIRSGQHKGAGVQGVKLSDEQFAELKRRVDVQARHFIAAVARGRGMGVDRVAEIADGRVFIGREAVAAGLADRVGAFEDVLAEAEQRTAGLMYRDLAGRAAAEQLDNLVADEQRQTLDGADVCRERVTARFTCLAEAAAAYESEQVLKLNSEHERWAARKKTAAENAAKLKADEQKRVAELKASSRRSAT
jgi:protease-4